MARPPLRTSSRTAAMPSCSLPPARATAAGTILAVTRWREDATCDDWGSYIYLRDMRSGDLWSAGLQPSGVDPDAYEVVFNEIELSSSAATEA